MSGPRDNAVTTQAPRQRMSRADRERQIVSIAERAFAERGYHHVTMDEIAEIAGISKPVIYEYFGSKAGLLLATFARAREELAQKTRQAVLGATRPKEMVRRGLVAFFTFLEEHQEAWSVLAYDTSGASSRTAEEIETIRREQTDLLATLMAAAGTPAPAQALQAYAQIIAGACERLAIWQQGQAGVTPEIAAGYLMDMLWTGLRNLDTAPGALAASDAVAEDTAGGTAEDAEAPPAP